jgi:hypothetical protein
MSSDASMSGHIHLIFLDLLVEEQYQIKIIRMFLSVGNHWKRLVRMLIWLFLQTLQQKQLSIFVLASCWNGRNCFILSLEPTGIYGSSASA